MMVYLFHVVEEKKRKSPCSFASSKKPSKSKAFEIIRYIVRAGRKLKTKAEMNLQTRTQKSYGQTIVAGNRLQENCMKSVSCRFCHADVPLLENVSASSGLGSFPVKTSIAPRGIRAKISLLTLLRNQRNSDLAKDIFHQEQHLSLLCELYC